MKVWSDFDAITGNCIGTIIEIDKDTWIYILTIKAHPWLKKFGDFYIGWQKSRKV